MLKEIIEIVKDLVKFLIDHHLELWYGEEFSDIPVILKVVISTFGVFISIVQLAFVIAFLPVVIIVGLLIKFFYKGSFGEQDDLS